ncbi:hypothetical protein LOY37_04065 [Pseudomonas sp. B21-012]|nr:hypothetical protein LOY37_04065 [Pseudomonas sp. B21-012]
MPVKRVIEIDDKAADALELLMMNQTAMRTAFEELNTWIRQRGSVNVADNSMVALQTLDTNAGAISSAIERLRS